MLGLGLQAPWKLIDQPLNTEHSPYEFHLQLGVERGALYSCSECGIACSAHDFKEKTWRHLTFFSTIAISQRKYLEFTVRLIDVPGQGLVVALLCYLRSGFNSHKRSVRSRCRQVYGSDR